MGKKILIIGAGAAGVAAALELNRRSIPFTLVEKNAIGGIAANASLIRNYPGFPDGISGKDFVDLLKKQILQFSIEVVRGDVESLEYKNRKIRASVSGENRYFEAAIIASGTIAKKANFEGEEQLDVAGKLFYEISDMDPDIYKDIVIVGGGDVAFDYIIFLMQKGVSVKIISRSEPKAIKFLRANAKKFGIKILQNETVLSAKSGRDGKVVLRTNSIGNLTTDCVIVAVGRRPNLSLLKNFGKIDIFDDGRTSVKRIFLAGDVLHPHLRHIGVAVGDGIRAADNAAKLL